MKVNCIECGGKIEDTDPKCEHCGAAQEVDVAELPAPSFPTAAIAAVRPPPPPAPTAAPLTPAPSTPLVSEPFAAIAPPFPTAATAAVTPPATPPPLSREPLPGTEPPPPTEPLWRDAPPPPPPPPPSALCAACGRPLAPENRFCSGCGTPRPEMAGAAPPPPPPSTGIPLVGNLPADLVAVCALMALAGVLILIPALRVIPDMLDLLTSGDGLGRSLGLLLATVWIVLAFFGGSCLFLAWRLTQSDRVARGLTYVLLGSLSLSLLFSSDRDGELTFVLLLSAAAGLVLAFSPGARAHFSGGYQGEHPEGLVIARTLIMVWVGLVGLVGLMFLPLGPLGFKWVLTGVLMLGIAGAAFYLNQRLATGDPVARIIITAGGAVYLILLLIVGDRSAGLLLPLAMVVGIACFLWIPPDVQRYFERRSG